MTTLMDGISKVQLYNTQIEQLRAMDSNNPADVNAALYSIEQSFNEMLNKFMSTDDDDDNKSNDSNMFNFLVESNQQTLNNVLALQNKQP
ncbi:MAG: hypothetical protein U9R38_08285 [Candidatus Margulisiibacteriota bacterium]|nr:hypothetical protein [Candidatus Margulisiibacteriota bacterium]